MFYIQLNTNNIILDIIEYIEDGYIEAPSLPTPLPEGINAGWYHWNGTEAILIPELKQATISNQIQQAIDDYTISLIEGGLL